MSRATFLTLHAERPARPGTHGYALGHRLKPEAARRRLSTGLGPWRCARRQNPRSHLATTRRRASGATSRLRPTSGHWRGDSTTASEVSLAGDGPNAGQILHQAASLQPHQPQIASVGFCPPSSRRACPPDGEHRTPHTNLALRDTASLDAGDGLQ